MVLHQKAPLSSSERGFLFIFYETTILTHPVIPEEENKDDKNVIQ